MFLPHQLLAIFGMRDPAVVAIGVQLLRVLSVSGLLIAVALTYTGGLQGTGDTKSPLYISIISQIIVPADTPGVEVVRPVPVLGHVGRGWNTHCEVRYRDARVPAANLLGERGDGFRIAQKRLAEERQKLERMHSLMGS